MPTIFHKILAREIPNHTVYEDDHVLAFLDIAPRSKGHTVVIPKVFGETLLDLPDEALAGYMTGIKRTIERIEAVLSPDGYSVGWNMTIGQAVPYIHCHIIPRWEGDGGGNMHTIVDSGTDDIADVAKLFGV